MGKTRDLLRKTEDIKRTFHASMGTIRDINANNLMKMRLRRCGKNIYIYKKCLNEPGNHNGVVSPQSHTSWNVKSKEPLEETLQTN